MKQYTILYKITCSKSRFYKGAYFILASEVREFRSLRRVLYPARNGKGGDALRETRAPKFS